MIGARLEAGGCRFRVWAPSAAEAHVVYNDHWEPTPANALARQPDGYWEALLPGLPAGTRYKFVFFRVGEEARIWRIDPVARATKNCGLNDPENGGFIVDAATSWPEFTTPAFEDLIIYQLHVGAFCGRNDEFATAAQANDETGRLSFLEAKLLYIRSLGFNAVQLLPINEFAGDRSWGYNPSFYYSVEPTYGTRRDLQNLIAQAHSLGLAVILDLVFNHVSDDGNSLWNWDVFDGQDHGEYLYPPFRTPWGWGPSFGKPAVRKFFIENARAFFDEYQVDGLRFDATRMIEANGDGWRFLQELTWALKESHPDRYLVAEHLPDHDSIVRSAGMHGCWFADSHHQYQRAAQGEDSLGKIKTFLGKDFGLGHDYPDGWNLVKYLLGSHDDCGDDAGGTTLQKPNDWERHRYFVEFYGGRDNWFARAKARLGWALNVAAMGTPMMFMGLECQHGGYWHDSRDANGDHRFDWSIAGDPLGMEMRRLVAAANQMRWENPCLRGETLDLVHEDPDNRVLAFKRYAPGAANCVLAVVNMGDTSFEDHTYGVATGGQGGTWTQILCTQDAAYGGWDGAGNAYYSPASQKDGRVYINLPKWSVVLLRLR